MKVAQTLSLDTKKQNTVANKTKKIKRQLKEGTLKIDENPKRKRTNPREHRGLIYIGHLPHGFYEEEITKYFKQFGRVTNVKVCRSRKTGNSKGYGYVEFEHSDVAKIAAETMNNYLMFKKRLTATFIPFEKRPKFLFIGKQSMPGNYSRKRAIEKNISSKNKTINHKTHIEQSKGRLTRLQKRLQKIKGYGIDIDLKPVDVPAALK